MERELMCSRTEICFIYQVYVDMTKDNKLGIIKVSKIENRDYYSCSALSEVKKLMREGKLPEEVTKRIGSENLDCLTIEQANKSVERRRSDF